MAVASEGELVMIKKTDEQRLIVSGMAPIEHGLLKELTRLGTLHGCTIVDSYFAKFGNEEVAHLLLTGSWSEIAKTETALQQLQREIGISIFWQRTEESPPTELLLPYLVYIIAQNEAHIAHEIVQFFTEQSITIQELFTDSYLTRQTQTPMQSITLRILIAADTSISQLRERFMLFCDDLNLDAIMEPEKS